jgi:hypothetical protein
VATVNGGVWGAIVAFERVGKKGDVASESGKLKGAAKYIVDVLVNTSSDRPLVASSGEDGAGPRSRLALLPPQTKHLQPQVVSISLSQVSLVLAFFQGIQDSSHIDSFFCGHRWMLLVVSGSSFRRILGRWMQGKMASNVWGRPYHDSVTKKEKFHC